VLLVDTSVWIDHLRARNVRLHERLLAKEVWSHPFIVGELACGHLSPRTKILRSLADLPQAPIVDHEQVLDLIEILHLGGRGLGWVNLHLIASSYVAQLPLWTLDTRMALVAAELGLTAS
jgi:predicted nucleic acid-binding protein